MTVDRALGERGGQILGSCQLTASPFSDWDYRNLDLSKFCIGQKEEQLPSYDLYAVINHYGGMIGGHYTACARLPNDRSSQRSDVGEGTHSQQDRW